jgi:hypothetical protein
MIHLYQQSLWYIKIVSSQEHERERDQTHSYWYIPSAPRVNYSLLIMETAGMMKMTSDDGFPLRGVPERAPDWFFVAIEACDGGTPNLGFFSEVSGYIGVLGIGITSGGFARDPQARRACPRGRTPVACGCLMTPLAHLRCSVGVFWSKKNHRESFIPFGLRLIFLFCETQKQGKNRNWHWALG